MGGIIPFWEIKHEWFLEDIAFEMFEHNFYCEMLKMHPDDEVGAGYRDIIKTINKRIKLLKRQYCDVYGRLPNKTSIQPLYTLLEKGCIS